MNHAAQARVARLLHRLGWHETADWSLKAAHEVGDHHEGLLKERFLAAVRNVNRRNDEPWLDPERLERVWEELTRRVPAGLVEGNRKVLEILQSGVAVKGLTDWDGGRHQVVRLIDWENPDANDFLLVTGQPVERPRDGGVSDIRLHFVGYINGIPFVVGAASSPVGGVRDAVDALRAWTGERALAPDRSVPALFRYVQILVATDGVQAKLGTVTSGPEDFAVWRTTLPVGENDVRAELKVTGSLSELETLLAGALRPAHLLDLVRNFSVFTHRSGTDRRIVARYQQFRAVHAMVFRLLHGGSPEDRGGLLWHTQGAGKTLTMTFLVRKIRTTENLEGFLVVVVSDRRDLRRQLTPVLRLSGEKPLVAKSSAEAREHLGRPVPGVVQMMIQQARRDDDAPRQVTGLVGDPEGVEFTAPVLSDSDRILLLVDEAHRTQSGSFHQRLRRSVPNAAMIGFTGTPIVRSFKRTTRDLFGTTVDHYRLVEAERDGTIVPIRYEGRHLPGHLIDRVQLDLAMEQEMEGGAAVVAIRELLESTDLIEAKARDMLAHWVLTGLPDGFKAQVVAVSRLAAVRYGEALGRARDALLAAVSQHQGDGGAYDGFEAPVLAMAYRFRRLLTRIEFAAVISHREGDPEEWKRWTAPEAHEDYKARFTAPFPLSGEREGFRHTDDTPWSSHARPDDAFADEGGPAPIAFLAVQSMLLTGFDAPLEQALYIDRSIRDAELLQAVARTNRTARNKRYGLVVDYVGIIDNLGRALAEYDQDDLSGMREELIDHELPLLVSAAKRMRDLLVELRVDSIESEEGRSEMLRLLEDPRTRHRFDAAVDELLLSVERLMPRGPALEHLDLARAVYDVQWRARRLFRDTQLGQQDTYRHGALLRELLDEHVRAGQARQQVPPVEITTPGFMEAVDAIRSGRDRALELQYALRHHLERVSATDPIRAQSISEQIDDLLRRLDGSWEELSKALRELVEQTLAPDADIIALGLDPRTEGPLHSIMEQVLAQEVGRVREPGLAVTVTRELVLLIRDEVRPPHFAQNTFLQKALRSKVRQLLIDLCMLGRAAATTAAVTIVQAVLADIEHFRDH
ncbi:type I restriction endonuclease subunit R [Streptosporangium sp. NPDC002721]|uniref:type I restriction endonuclease subunit R n=1 Tax=Streptosporangium sp. NPDC002721 TaxID=3366188 RepID=UPI0036AFA2C7